MKVRISPKGTKLTIEAETEKEKKLLLLWDAHFGMNKAEISYVFPEDKKSGLTGK